MSVLTQEQQDLRATFLEWAQRIAVNPEAMVKSSFEAMRRVVMEMDRVAALRAPLAKPQETKNEDQAARVDKGTLLAGTGSTASTASDG